MQAFKNFSLYSEFFLYQSHNISTDFIETRCTKIHTNTIILQIWAANSINPYMNFDTDMFTCDDIEKTA